MHACLSKIHSLREKMAQKTYLEDVYHVVSSNNISDICTRMESNLRNIGHGSVWQIVPEWLRKHVTPVCTLGSLQSKNFWQRKQKLQSRLL